jgi:membrane fusion protein, multidrug efflux system
MPDLRQISVSGPTRANHAFAVVLLLSLAVASCSQGAASDASGTPTESGRGANAPAAGRGVGPAVVVTTATVVQKPMAVDVRAVGNVEASSSVDVRSQVSGTLVSVDFTEGADVTAEQVLFTIDPRQFEVAVKQAEAAVARSTAQVKGMNAQVTRAEELFGRGLLPRSEREALHTQMSVLEASVAADTAQLEDARLQLQHTKIVAPVSGRTGALLVHKGALVRANDTEPLVVINQISPAFVSFAVPARLLPQLRRDRAALKVLAAPAGTIGEPPSSGTVSFVDNAVDQATDSIRLKATFPNRDRKFWAGAFVDVTLELSVEERAIVVPNASVQPSQQGQFVYVVKSDQTVEARPVKVARIAGNDAVIESGVQPGETVVTDGQLRLTPGARVSVKPAEGQPRTTS